MVHLPLSAFPSYVLLVYVRSSKCVRTIATVTARCVNPWKIFFFLEEWKRCSETEIKRAVFFFLILLEISAPGKRARGESGVRGLKAMECGGGTWVDSGRKKGSLTGEGLRNGIRGTLAKDIDLSEEIRWMGVPVSM